MYFVGVVLLLLVFPAASVVVDIFVQFGTVSETSMLALVGKWFTFWAVGVRLGMAGLMQIFRPQYTVKEILGIDSQQANVLARELGFANFIFGTMGIISMFHSSWLIPAAYAGGLYYVLAGLGHIATTNRNPKETFALATDFYAGIVLIIFLIASVGAIG